jgi:hypothetical protein
MIRQAFGEENMSHSWVFEWHALFRVDQKKQDRWRPKPRICLSFSLASRGLFTKNSSSQTKQLVPHTTVFYSDCMKMCEDFTPNFGDKTERPSLWHNWGRSRQDRRLCWTPSKNMTSRMHLKNGRSTGNGACRRRGLLRGWWWPVGPKLVFDQMAAPVPEIMDVISVIVL